MRFLQTWQGRNCQKDGGALFDAQVPGNIQFDYGVAHGFGDPQYADNCKKYLPLEDDDWEYITHLSYEKKEGERVFFVSKGIQYRYYIALNGKILLEREGMYTGVEIDLTDELTGKDDILTVHIYPHPKRKGAPVGTRDEADDCCQPPVCYGWDWNPRLLISGMWEDAYVETRDEYFIGNTEVLSSLSSDLTKGRVTYSYDCKKPCRFALYDENGREVLSSESVETLTLDSPELWWCNGQGKPTLYTWRIFNEKCSVEGQIGFRTLKLVQNTGATGPKIFPKSRYEAPITIELNGRRIFGKGSNWVNPELFWGHANVSVYEPLLSLARDCHMNILRIWGGAGPCKESFYSLCDRYGIIVWQEFMLACNNYLGTDNYMKVLNIEATSIIKKLRSHASLGFWCGGNELFNHWSGMDEQSKPLRLLNKLCFELDPERPFLYTSPLFGMAHGGYMFYAEKQRGEVFNQFQKANNTAYTEFGVPALTPLEELKKIIPEEELCAPIPETSSWIEHHGYNAGGVYEQWICPSVMDMYFGKTDSLEKMIEQSEWLQCEGYRGAFEEGRRQWPHCSMSINWCYNEPWITAANNSLLTYPAKPKPAYEYVKAALRPTLFSARVEKFEWNRGETFSAELWLLNDAPESASGIAEVSLQIGDRSIDLLSWKAETGACAHIQGPTVRCILPAVDTDRLYLTVKAENGLESRYCFKYVNKPPKVNLVKLMNQ